MTRNAQSLVALSLRVSVTDARGRALGSGPASGLAAWLTRAAPARVQGSVALAIVSDDVMRQLNRAYRKVNRATDVLSFPREEGFGGQARRTSRTRAFGDIAIARGVAAAQAKAAGHSLQTELRVLALHGLLHLLGYDHEADTGEMERVEDRLRRRAGLPAGLIGRAARLTRSQHR